jgi:hypothetical protein
METIKQIDDFEALLLISKITLAEIQATEQMAIENCQRVEIGNEKCLTSLRQTSWKLR